MTDLISLFKTIIEIYGPTSAGIIIVVLAIVYAIHFITKHYSAQIKKYFDDKGHERDKLHGEAAKYRKNATPLVREEISHLAKEIGADRVVVFEFSNGNSNLVGLPFLYMTATNEVITRGTATMSQNYQRVNTCILAEFLEKLEVKGYFYTEEINELKDSMPMLHDLLKSDNIKTALFYNLYGSESTIGFIMAVTVKGPSFTRDIALPRIAEVAQKVSGLLNFNELHERL